ncbi:MAG TPA: NUDIX domain-containing protein [Planctomycetota bacterium]|nr:NUDIX domain-containing protein [Planctomycetota bacterium]
MKSIRNSAKAIIIHGGRLLCTKNLSYKKEIYYLLPGGGQDPGETLPQALTRECREELGAEIRVGALRYIREYIGRNHEFREIHESVHQIEYMFGCELADPTLKPRSQAPDSEQIGIEWVDLKSLNDTLFFPRILRRLILPNGVLSGELYLGDVN